MESDTCSIIITQKDLNRFINTNSIIKELLFKKFITLRSIFDVFPCEKSCKTKIWKKTTWLDGVVSELSSSVVLKGIGKSWLRNEIFSKIYDTYCSKKECEYTGFFICANKTLVNMDKSITNHPIGLIIMRNAKLSDNFNIKCKSQKVPNEKIVYGEIVSSNPDLQELGIGKLLIGIAVLYFRFIQKEVAILSIAHGWKNKPAYYLYSSFGFIEETINIGPEDYGSSLASLVAYPFRKVNQHYTIISMPKMIWCMGHDTLEMTMNTLKKELEKDNYRGTDITRRLPNPKTKHFTTLIGQLYWTLIYKHLREKHRLRDPNYTLPEYLYTDEYYEDLERKRDENTRRRKLMEHSASLNKQMTLF